MARKKWSRQMDNRMKDCDYCGGLFRPIRVDARFCGAACRQRACRVLKAGPRGRVGVWSCNSCGLSTYRGLLDSCPFCKAS